MANPLVKFGRWAKGLVSDTRRDPSTGARQERLGARGGWININAAKTPHPRPQGKSTSYLQAPRGIATQASRRQSAPIGMGRIGTGEGIGTTRGTASASWKGGKPSVGSMGIIGFSRIGGAIRGSAGSSAAASASGS